MKMGRITGLFSLFVAVAMVFVATSAFAAPANDLCTGAVDITPTYVGATTTDASTGAEDSGISTCKGDPTDTHARSVWYTFTGNGQTVEISTLGSDYDTVIAVYDAGSCGAFTNVAACNDDSGATWQSNVRFQTVNDVTYYIEVMGYDSYEYGNLKLTVEYVNGAPCTLTQVSPYDMNQTSPAINSYGEIAWIEADAATASANNIESTVRGTVAGATAMRSGLSMNNRGDLVWSQVVGGFAQVFKQDSTGTVTQVTSGSVNHADPSINDAGTIVWAQDDGSGGNYQIYKKPAGGAAAILSASANNQRQPSINNNDKVAWSEFSAGLYRIQNDAGVSVAAATADQTNPSLNDLNVIAWSEGGVIKTSDSSFTSAGCFAGTDDNPVINNCGSVAFTNTVGGYSQVYLSGNENRCLADVTAITPNPVFNNVTTAVTLIGSGFTGATAVKLYPGNVALTGVNVVNDTKITATVPNLNTSLPGQETRGWYDVQVTTSTGTNPTSTEKLKAEPNCDPNTNFVTQLNVTVTNESGTPIAAAGQCTKVVINADTAGTGCNVEYGYQVRRLGIDPYWRNIPLDPSVSEWKMDKRVIWDTTGLPTGNYTIRVFARNKEGTGNFSTNQKGVNPVVMTGGATTFALSAGCSDPEPWPVTCNPNSDYVTQLSVSVKKNGQNVASGTIGDLIEFTADTGGTGCLVEYGFQCRNGVPGAWVDTKWSNIPVGGVFGASGENAEWTMNSTVTWDTKNNAAGNYTCRVFARNREGSGNFVVNQKGVSPIVYYNGATAFALSVQTGNSVLLTANPSGAQVTNWNVPFEVVDLSARPASGYNPTSYTFEISPSGLSAWTEVAGCEQPGQGGNSLCGWDAELSGEGVWDLRVSATDGVTPSTSSITGYSLVRIPPSVGLAATPSGPQSPAYQDVILKASAVNFKAPKFRFEYRKVGDANYSVACDWRAINTCTWATSSLSSGTYDVKVYGSDKAPFPEAVNSLTYVLNP